MDMPESWYNDLKLRAKSLAEEIVEEKINFTEGVRKLESLLSRLEMDMDKRFLGIKCVDSESDEFPIGGVRKHWNTVKLEELDKKRKKFEEFYRKDIVEECRLLIDSLK